MSSSLLQKQQNQWAYYTDRHERRRVAHAYIHTHTHTHVLPFDNSADWHTGVCFTPEATVYFLYTSSLALCRTWRLRLSPSTFWYTSCVSCAEYQQFASHRHCTHTLYHKHNIHMWYEQHYNHSERTAATDWRWLAHEGTWQQMRRSVQTSAAVYLPSGVLQLLRRSCTAEFRYTHNVIFVL
jgi:hypothetical protein